MTTTIAAVLCWYDEPPHFLDRCIRSLADIADILVAHDGAWHPYPSPQPRSPREQHQTLADSSRAAGLTLLAPASKIWSSQIAKRAAAAHAASQRADWILSIDADEWIDHADPHTLHEQLAHTDLHVATVAHRNVTGDDHPNVDLPLRRIYRAHPTLTVTGSHQGYQLGNLQLDGDTRDGLQLEPALNLTEHIRIHHTPRSRSPQRNAAAKTYRHARARTGER